MRLFIAFGLLFFLPITFVCAQVDAETASNHVIIKYSPLPMFDPDNTIQFGVEIPLGNSGFTFQQDLGYGRSNFSMWYREFSNAPDKQTFKSRSHIRYYYFDRRRVRGYFGAEFLFKKVVYRENQWVGMDCSGFGGCGYFENKDFKIGRLVSAGHTRIGWQFYFPSRLTMDLFTGFGLRHVRVKSITPGLENINYAGPNEYFATTTPGTNEYVPSLVLGFHLGIVLGKFDD